MVKLSEFVEVINSHLSQQHKIDEFSNIGCDIWEWDVIEYGNIIFDKLLNTWFTEEGVDWIYWWLYERNGNPEMKAWDENKNEIKLDTVYQLFDLVKNYTL